MIITMIICLALVLFILRITAIDILTIDGRSMEKTLVPGQMIVVNKLYYGILLPLGNRYIIQWGEPARGDVVLFFNNFDNTITVKRCIAIAGDMLKVIEDKLFINDKILPLKYYQEIKWKNYTQVPKGYIFVAGDNLNFSVDSREYGFVPYENIFGCVMFVR